MSALRICLKILFFSMLVIGSLNVISALSPLNSRRPEIGKIRHIILHTTEASVESSLPKLKRFGEAHYLIDRNGQIYKIIDENKIARHSGRSIWNGQSRVDEFSIGIEMVGHHDKAFEPQQERALANLLRDLKTRYRIKDDDILTHSMVAYGVPNRYHHESHRGRKRCGMLMADPAFRARVGIGPGPTQDPDAGPGKLKIADPYLNAILYNHRIDPVKLSQAVYASEGANTISKYRSAWFIAREKYNDPATIYTLPNGAKLRGDQIKNWNQISMGTKVSYSEDVIVNESTRDTNLKTEKLEFKEIDRDGRTAREVAGADYTKSTTIYFLNDRRVFTGKEMAIKHPDLLEMLPIGTRILLGYVYGGFVTKERSAFNIAKKRWNSPATVYRIPPFGQIRTGDEINSNEIAQGTLVFFEK